MYLYVYYRHLLVSMGERTVVVCEPLLCAQIWRDVIAQVLLVDFEVSYYCPTFFIVCWL